MPPPCFVVHFIVIHYVILSPLAFIMFLNHRGHLCHFLFYLFNLDLKAYYFLYLSHLGWQLEVKVPFFLHLVFPQASFAFKEPECFSFHRLLRF
jgi:hypothetical protein